MNGCSELFVLCVRAPVPVSAQPIGRGSSDGRLRSEYAAELRDKAFMRGAVRVRSGLSGFRSSRAAVRIGGDGDGDKQSGFELFRARGRSDLGLDNLE